VKRSWSWARLLARRRAEEEREGLPFLSAIVWMLESRWKERIEEGVREVEWEIVLL